MSGAPKSTVVCHAGGSLALVKKETRARPAARSTIAAATKRPARVGRPGAGVCAASGAPSALASSTQAPCSRSAHRAPSRSPKMPVTAAGSLKPAAASGSVARVRAVGVVDGDALVVQAIEDGDAIARARQILRGVGVERDRRQRAALRVEAGDAAVDVVEDDDAARVDDEAHRPLGERLGIAATAELPGGAAPRRRQDDAGVRRQSAVGVRRRRVAVRAEIDGGARPRRSTAPPVSSPVDAARARGRSRAR